MWGKDVFWYMKYKIVEKKLEDLVKGNGSCGRKAGLDAGGWVKFIYGIGCRGFHMKGEFVILLTGRERRRVELWKISACTIFVFRARMD